ncbi:MAG: agmatinase [Acidobacteria bacterium]|nr:MAG: agmatinase [Acidobacteriota bacterium]
MPKTPGDHAFTAESPYGTVAEPTYSGALSFMRRRYTRDLKGVDVAVTGVPLDLATSNRPGARFGPAAIRKASAQLAWGLPWPWNFSPFDRLAVVDYGDCYFDSGRPEQIPQAIEAHARTILDAGVFMLSLGGDHFISLPLLRAHARAFGPLALVHFDAHSDTWRDEAGRIDHGTMFFHAVQEGLVDPRRSVQIGIRTHNDETHGFTVLDARRVLREPPETTLSEIKKILGSGKAYFTFDIDCLDPSCAPGTGTPVVGGLPTHLALEIVRGLAGVDFAGGDVTEVAPTYDVGEITALAGATIALEFLCLRAAKSGRPAP